MKTKLTILVILATVFAGCFSFHVIRRKPMEVYNFYASNNPDQICTILMFNRAWEVLNRNFYHEPLEDKDIYTLAADSLGKYMGKSVKIPKVPKSYYSPGNFWFKMDNLQTSLPKDMQKTHTLSEACYQTYEDIFKKLNKKHKDIYNKFMRPEEARKYVKKQQGAGYVGLGFWFVSVGKCKQTCDSKCKDSKDLDCREKCMDSCKDRSYYVGRVFPRSPAKRGGMKQHDKIVAVNGIQVQGKKFADVLPMLHGVKGTKVKVTLLRKGWKGAKTFTFTRDKIEGNYTECKLLPGKIPLCRIDRFALRTPNDFIKAFTALPKDHQKVFILDLRNNPGGLVNPTLSILGKFWIKSKVGSFLLKKDGGIIPIFDNAQTAFLEGYQTIALVNDRTASSAEMLLAALKDYNLVTVIGETTYKKGVSQATTIIDGGAMVKVTALQALSPVGHRINNVGIKPDIKVVMTDKDRMEARDMHLETALALIKAATTKKKPKPGHAVISWTKNIYSTMDIDGDLLLYEKNGCGEM